MKRALITLVTALLLSTPGPASAADPAGEATDVGLSLDGIHYQGDLDDPLFDPRARWVPGEVRRSSFWVRNQASDPGDLTVDLLARSPRTLIDSGYLSIAARAGDGPWRVVETTGGSMRLFTTKDLPPKAEVPVTVRITLSPDAHNGTMVLATVLDLQVTLTDARASGPDSPEDPGDSAGLGGLLPGTGSSTSWWVLPLGMLLVAAGASQLAGRRPAVILPFLTHPSGDTE